MIALPSGLKPTVAVRFSPLLYRRQSCTLSSGAIPGPNPHRPCSPSALDAPPPPPSPPLLPPTPPQLVPDLGHRMVLAVATMDSVMLYETEVRR